jgi:hypothetical protein
MLRSMFTRRRAAQNPSRMVTARMGTSFNRANRERFRKSTPSSRHGASADCASSEIPINAARMIFVGYSEPAALQG